MKPNRPEHPAAPKVQLPDGAVFTELERAVAALATHTGLILGFKDAESRHVHATDAYAALVGLRSGREVAGRLDCDMPCEGTARFAADFVAEDLQVMARHDADGALKIINIHRYSTGLAALMFEKRAIRAQARGPALGTVYCAHEIDPTPLLALLPAGADRPDFGLSARCIDGGARIASVGLTPHEHEVSFLLALGWAARDVARLLDRIRPRPVPRSVDGIYKCRARICNKLDLSNLGARRFRDLMVASGMLAKLPASLLLPLVGSRPVESGSRTRRHCASPPSPTAK